MRLVKRETNSYLIKLLKTRDSIINNILTDPDTDDTIYNCVTQLYKIKNLSPLMYDIYTLTRLYTIKEVAKAYCCSPRLICYKLREIKNYMLANDIKFNNH